jgi:putative hemolysin
MEIVVLGILIVVNGIFSMYEIALVSSRKTRLEERANRGSKGAQKALHLLNEPEYVLSAIQVAITLIGIVSGAYGGVALSADVEPFIRHIPYCSTYSETIAMIIVVGAITYFSLVIGELVPKTIALNNAERIASLLSPFMRVVTVSFFPIVWVLSVSTRTINFILRVKKSTEPQITEEELRLLLKKGSETGVFEPLEHDMISDVLRFSDQTAYTLMIPRYDVEWIDVEDAADRILSLLNSSSLSFFPLCKGSLDHIVGVVSLRDILAQQMKGEELNLRNIAEDPLFIPENLRASKILGLLKDKGMHYGLVVNEYGSFEGVITLHSILESIMGDFPSNDITEEPDFVVREDGSLLIDGSVHLDRLKGILQLPPETTFDEDNGISTLGGFAMFILDKIPMAGEKFTSNGFIFEIVDMDGNRVDKLLIKKS